MSTRKEEIITFKVDNPLKKRLSGLRNRSEFIRSAVLLALDSSCPLCGGSGVLSPKQAEHWRRFTAHHHVEECPDCNEIHLVCDACDDGGHA